MALSYQNEHSVSNLKKCPHCGLIWTKVSGCDGETTCGNINEDFDSRFSVFATFTFAFDGENFLIEKSGSRSLEKKKSNGRGTGCGKKIIWRDMTPVAIPEDFKDLPIIDTNDISEVQLEQRQLWHDYFEDSRKDLVVENVYKLKKINNK